MANNVFANMMEISCKAADGKSVACFPDVCFTPPTAPPTPPGVPIPYPNTGMASDATAGSKTVKIGGKEVMLKDKSYFKQSTGDEAGSAPKKGVLTSMNKGKVYFTAWSMNVKIEGENVVRHFDLTTHNHASQTGNTPPWPYLDQMNPEAANIAECKDDVERVNNACQGNTPPKCSPECASAQKCILAPKSKDKKVCCEPDRTGHHLVEVHCFSKTGARGSSLSGFDSYKQSEAPCVCASESRHEGSHQILHAVQGKLESAFDALRSSPLASWAGAGAKIRGTADRAPAVSKWTYKEAREAGVKAQSIANPQCNVDCTAKQLDSYHKDKCGMEDDTPVRTDPQAGTRTPDDCLDPAQKGALDAAVDAVTGVGSKAF
jgi:hypothetical protein